MCINEDHILTACNRARYESLFLIALSVISASALIPLHLGEYAEINSNSPEINNSFSENLNNYKFTVAWITDTQYYSRWYPEVLQKVVNWINTEAQGGRIHYVVNTGDLIDEYGNVTQWQTFSLFWSNLTVENDVLAGNHDNSRGGNWTFYDSYFPDRRYYYKLKDDWLFIFISFSLGNNTEVQTWLRNVTQQYHDKKTIVLTHAYIDNTMALIEDGPSIKKILNEYSSRDFAIWCGHSHVNKIIHRTDNNVVGILYDFQNYGNGGNGYLVLANMYENGFYMRLFSVIDGFDGRGKGEGSEISVVFDLMPPTTLHDYEGSWHKTDVVVTLTATDDRSGVAETYYKVNDGPIKNVSVNGQPRIATEGSNNTLEYWSVDNTGKEETPHKTLTGIKLDKTQPRADAGRDQTVNVNETVTFDSSNSTDNIGIISYEWNFGDGTSSEGTKVTHAYSSPEIYKATLTIKDAAGNASSHTITITVLAEDSSSIWIAAAAIAAVSIAATMIYLWKNRK